ncbi:MAG: hypothetical protein PHY82_00185 [Lentisphaeria bacterium]|nr:hypothetical protein [Lentisphaeria bacterium]
MSQMLTSLAKQAAFGYGADLVGVGSIGRWAKAPLLMSPLGLMPEGKSVLVCAVHHTDGMIEIGGEGSPHEQGTYSFQYHMNNLLDVISYRMACFFEDRGYRAIPITASNIWRYREYKGLQSTFAPDMSHIYASVCAGLTEMGYSGLAMSPEYGPRNRFVSIITDAPLIADPLLPGNTLCDHCGQCIQHCATAAMSKEVRGTVSLEIEGHTYSFADKNLWRCAWSEHFGLDCDAELPEKVDEPVILDKLKELGMRGGTMGCCLKYCLPRDKRSWNKSYSSAPIRKKNAVANRPDPDRGVQQRLLSFAFASGAERVVIQKLSDLQARYGDLKPMLPDGRSVIWVCSQNPKQHSDAAGAKLVDFGFAATFSMNQVVFHYASELEKLGYSGAPYFLGSSRLEPLKSCFERMEQAAKDMFGKIDGVPIGFALTSAELPESDNQASLCALTSRMDLTDTLRRVAREQGVDLVGVSSAGRIAKAVESIRGALEGQSILNVRETGRLWLGSAVEVDEFKRVLHVPGDHLKAAKSVIVLGIRTPAESSECMGRRPAEAIGPYSFAQYESHHLLNRSALQLLRRLNAWGYKGIVLSDLENSGSKVSNPRGDVPNLFANRVSAVCAGLGTLTKGGFVNHPEFGTNVRFVAIVTDAELSEDQLADLQSLRSKCEGCERCLSKCTMNAFAGKAVLAVDDQKLEFHYTDQKRCDWALRFGLNGDEGNKFTGSKTNVPAPAVITAASLAEAMEKRDPILRIRPCSAEMCAMACPYTRTQED